MNNFEKIDSLVGVGKLINRGEVVKYTVPPAEIGDFLARLWNLFGEPNSVHYEGFDYSLKHKPSGIEFLAYCAGSGPSYSQAKNGTDEEVINIISELEELLQNTKPVDCEIRFETDFGVAISGSKEGIPFDEIIESDEE